MNLINQVKLKDLLVGKEASVSGDGYNIDIVISASIVDNKPLIFLSTYVLKPSGNGVERDYMQSSESFRTLKASKYAVA